MRENIQLGPLQGMAVARAPVCDGGESECERVAAVNAASQAKSAYATRASP